MKRVNTCNHLWMGVLSQILLVLQVTETHSNQPNPQQLNFKSLQMEAKFVGSETDKPDVCFRHGWIQGQRDVWNGLLSSSSLHWLYTQAGVLHTVVLAAPPRVPPSLHPTIHPEEREPPFPNSANLSLNWALSHPARVTRPSLSNRHCSGPVSREGIISQMKNRCFPQQKGE